MTMTNERKGEIINEYRLHEKDTGSAEVQVALLTQRIGELGPHFTAHKKDHASRRGLLKMVGRRRKLLSYLKKHDEDTYRNLIVKLGIRK